MAVCGSCVVVMKSSERDGLKSIHGFETHCCAGPLIPKECYV